MTASRFLLGTFLPFPKTSLPDLCSHDAASHNYTHRAICLYHPTAIRRFALCQERCHLSDHFLKNVSLPVPGAFPSCCSVCFRSSNNRTYSPILRCAGVTYPSPVCRCMVFKRPEKRFDGGALSSPTAESRTGTFPKKPTTPKR